MPVFIAAEIGVNWNGDRSRIPAFIDAAKATGSDAAKFQAFNAKALIARRGITDPKTIALLERCELTDADLDAIAAHCKAIGFKWGCSVFDTTQAARVRSRGAAFLKIGHKEADWRELLDSCVVQGCSVWVSNPPWKWIDEPTVGKVWCVAEYPAISPPKLHNIDCCRAEAYQGFSSHYKSWRIPAAAALRGAQYVEAHVYVNADEPEQPWSLHVSDFKEMVKAIRESEKWL